LQQQCPTIKYYENTKYILNKNYQWILTFGLLKYMLSSKLLGLFSYTCMLQTFVLIYISYICIYVIGITFARRKSITIARKMYTRFVLHLPCLHLRELSVI
jgi:hypothetical protein